MGTTSRSAARTRGVILEAAKSLFARDGYERSTIRGIAGAAGVDPALVMRHFGSKERLFVEAADVELVLPDLTGLSPDAIARALVSRLFEVWENDTTFLALLRAAATSDVAAERMRRLFQSSVVPALAKGAIDQPVRRAALVGSQVLGFAFSRYVLRTPGLVEMSHDDVLQWLGPALTRYLTDA